jgi:hypothetical protein
MATPHVAGAWAVMKQATGGSVSSILSALQSTGVSITDSNGITKKRIQLDNAAGTVVPSAPILKSPSGNIYTALPKYKWNTAAGATDYRIQVKDKNSQVVIDAWYTKAQANCANNVCKKTPATLLKLGNHTWKIKAKNKAGSSAWSSIMTFTTKIPPTPILKSPSGNVYSRILKYKWKISYSASHYRLQVKNASGKVLIDKWYTKSQVGCANGVCSKTLLLTLTPGTNSWMVKAKSNWGVTAWSTKMNIKGRVPTPAPVIRSPIGKITDTTPRYKWETSYSATHYRVKVKRFDGKVMIDKWYTKAEAACVNGICAFSPNIKLPKGYWFKWWVKAKNYIGTTAWSARKDFKVQ